MTDIRAGDVVVCVDDGPCRCCGLDIGIPLRAVRRVRWAKWDVNVPTGIRVLAIGVDGLRDIGAHRARRGVNSARFRKIKPADDRFTQQLRKCRPLRTREDA